MTKAVEAVLADALRLDLDARAEVAAELLASLDGPADPDAEAAWAVEIERRVAAIEAETVKLEPWEDVKRRIEAPCQIRGIRPCACGFRSVAGAAPLASVRGDQQVPGRASRRLERSDNVEGIGPSKPQFTDYWIAGWRSQYRCPPASSPLSFTFGVAPS